MFKVTKGYHTAKMGTLSGYNTLPSTRFNQNTLKDASGLAQNLFTSGCWVWRRVWPFKILRFGALKSGFRKELFRERTAKAAYTSCCLHVPTSAACGPMRLKKCKQLLPLH